MRTAMVMCLAFAGLAVHAAEPTEASLLTAWEELQRADPKVTRLEKTGAHEYRFETTHFPYQGTLVVTDAVVDGGLGEYVDAVGYVQVKLPEMAETLLQDHAYAYSIWARGNTLYWDENAARWIGWSEQQQQWQADVPEPAMPWTDWLWFALLLALCVAVLLTVRNARRNMNITMAAQQEALAQQRRAMEMMARGLALSEDTNRLLRDIRDRLEASQ